MEIEEDTALDIISQLQEENLNLRKQICVLERLIAHGYVCNTVNSLDLIQPKCMGLILLRWSHFRIRVVIHMPENLVALEKRWSHFRGSEY